MVKAENILAPKVEAHGFVDLIAIGAIKQIEEQLTAPIIGNGTLVSGLIKGVIGGIIDGKGGKIGHYISGAFGVDAGEDIAITLLQMAGLSNVGAATGAGNAAAATW